MVTKSGEEAKSEKEENVAVAGSKKDPDLKRQELLVNSGLAERLIDVCIENAEEFLKSNFDKEVIYEVAMGGFDGILCPSLSENLSDLYVAISSVAAKPKPQETGEEFRAHGLKAFLYPTVDTCDLKGFEVLTIHHTMTNEVNTVVIKLDTQTVKPRP